MNQISSVMELKLSVRTMLSRVRNVLPILQTRHADFSGTELGVDVFQK